VVAGLGPAPGIVHEPIAAGRELAGARTIAVVGVIGGVITGLAVLILQVAIATFCEGARVGARVGVVVVAVVACLAQINGAVATAAQRARVTAIVGDVVAVVATLTRADEAVAADVGHAAVETRRGRAI